MKKRLGKLFTWLKNDLFPVRLIFLATGLISTLWFLIRVIPKPSRASYPCMRMAAPLMSGFVIYLLSLGGIALAIRKARIYYLRARYVMASTLVIVATVFLGVFMSQQAPSSLASSLDKTGPDDGPNQPMGSAQGFNPGRVVWVWNPEASNENCMNVFDLPKPENTNQGVVNRMVVDGITQLTGNPNLSESWDLIFRSFNYKKSGSSRGYTRGERIFIKVNQGTASTQLRKIDEKSGFDVPKKYLEHRKAQEGLLGATETFPSVALEILRELVYVVGVDQKDIAIGDPLAHIWSYNYEVWVTEFPDVVYVDKSSELFGRTLIHPTEKDLVFYSDQAQRDKLYDVIEEADYMINLANLKPHGAAGVSFTAKNHFGSHARRKADHLHYSLVAPFSKGVPTNKGYGKYRAQVDLMGSKYLGRNSLLYVVDGIYGGGSIETKVPVKYFMPPFNNDWCNSLFISQDQVALESVCYDFLRTEWNGTYSHNAANNSMEDMVNVNGVDDYLHQAADSSNWPEGIIYDPDNSGTAMASLGAHEHWNNAAKKQYSRNLGLAHGIELISVPDTLVGGKGPEVSTSDQWIEIAPVVQEESDQGKENEQAEQESLTSRWEARPMEIVSSQALSFEGTLQAENFNAAVVDENNTKWFLSDAGIVSFDGVEWTTHNENRKIPVRDLKSMAFDSSEFGMELWFASPMGATVTEIPVDANSGATTYYEDNSDINSENVFSVAVGKGSLRWFGTEKGISAFLEDKWLPPVYQRKYPEYMFKDFPITALATNPAGDSLYIGTKGAGVGRVYRNDVDAISGASEYAQWGPILMPSNNVTCIYIAPDGTQWFGTDAGVARHTGNITMENWKVFIVGNGLINNEVQSITGDLEGNIWIGTRGGISIIGNRSLRTLTEKEGLPSNNVLCIAVDKDGAIWIGTDSGVTSYFQGKLITYKNQ